MKRKRALVIVDMQNYYLNPASPYSRYFEMLYPGSLRYIHERCSRMVVPNIRKLIMTFRKKREVIVYLRLCGIKEDRSDLHRFFRETWEEGCLQGIKDVYPLKDDSMADIPQEIKPEHGDIIINKTTFSPFSSTDIHEQLVRFGIGKLVCTGLATSQCVETTARDASDRGFDIIHIEDAQADYDETSHMASLYSSRGVCGGMVYSADECIEKIL